MVLSRVQSVVLGIYTRSLLAASILMAPKRMGVNWIVKGLSVFTRLSRCTMAPPVVVSSLIMRGLKSIFVVSAGST